MIKKNFYISEEILNNCIDPAILIETIDKARCESHIVIVSEEETRDDEQNKAESEE